MSKIESQHLHRRAYVYARQSTMAQVERNVESRERQYELVDRAVALGWHATEVVVVDCDQGQSGKSTDRRDGFHGLVADVGLGRVGIVLGIEVSRLARNNASWYQLLDLCAKIGDEASRARRERPIGSRAKPLTRRQSLSLRSATSP
jgi:DNA invertase Pin-like site-specific DNA recombinase